MNDSTPSGFIIIADTNEYTETLDWCLPQGHAVRGLTIGDWNILVMFNVGDFDAICECMIDLHLIYGIFAIYPRI